MSRLKLFSHNQNIIATQPGFYDAGTYVLCQSDSEKWGAESDRLHTDESTAGTKNPGKIIDHFVMVPLDNPGGRVLLMYSRPMNIGQAQTIFFNNTFDFECLHTITASPFPLQMRYQFMNNIRTSEENGDLEEYNRISNIKKKIYNTKLNLLNHGFSVKAINIYWKSSTRKEEDVKQPKK